MLPIEDRSRMFSLLLRLFAFGFFAQTVKDFVSDGPSCPHDLIAEEGGDFNGEDW